MIIALTLIGLAVLLFVTWDLYISQRGGKK